MVLPGKGTEDDYRWKRTVTGQNQERKGAAILQLKVLAEATQTRASSYGDAREVTASPLQLSNHHVPRWCPSAVGVHVLFVEF
jgi:hypothetical protein